MIEFVLVPVLLAALVFLLGFLLSILIKRSQKRQAQQQRRRDELAAARRQAARKLQARADAETQERQLHATEEASGQIEALIHELQEDLQKQPTPANDLKRVGKNLAELKTLIDQHHDLLPGAYWENRQAAFTELAGKFAELIRT